MRDVLIDVRCLQDPDCAATALGRQALRLLRGARGALPGDRLIGLVDPRRPVPEQVRSLLDEVKRAADTGAMQRPTCLVQLAPGAADALALARTLLHPEIPSITVAPPAQVPAMERHWLGHYDRVVPQGGSVWAEARSLQPLRAPAVLSGTRAKLAVLTAGGDDALLAALRTRADICVFTPGPQQLLGHWPLLSAGFDRVISLIGNRPGDARVLAAAYRFGGAIVLRDPCLLATYDGDTGTIAGLAEAELGRAVAESEVDRWRRGEIRPPALLLGDVTAVAEPLIVHAAALEAEVGRRFGRIAVTVPLPIAPRKPAIGCTGAAIEVAAITSGCSAGEACIWALEMLGSWGVDARLRLVGTEDPACIALTDSLGVTDRVGFNDAVGEPDVLLVVAMRGQPSVTDVLVSSIARFVPCVASASFAETFDLPIWVPTVPDQPSPPLLAEAILRALETRPDAAAVQAFRLLHAPARCARLFCEALGIDA